MLLPIKWLSQYVEIDEPIEKIGERFYEIGFGVESIINGEILDLEITPNRGDALSVYGLAREYAASSLRQLKKINHDLPIVNNKNIEVAINSTDILAYHAIVLDEIQVKKSPEWLIARLKEININPLNNIVDITNYIMHDLGQPLHAFDLDKLNSNRLLIRQAKDDENIITLNNQKHILSNGDLVVEANGLIVDLVGIQGGRNSRIDNNTKRILIQAVVIDPKRIRKTIKKLNFSSEAGYRFERYVNPAFARVALAKAYNEIKKISGANLLQTIDKKTKVDQRNIDFKFEETSEILGTNIKKDKTKKILTSLGFIVSSDRVKVPFWRINDIFSSIDLVEEIARLYGYNNLTKSKLKRRRGTKLPTDREWTIQTKVCNRLIKLGFTEIQTYPFRQNLDKKNMVEIANPLSAAYKYLRSNLKDGLIEAAENNIWARNIMLFEIGNIFKSSKEYTCLGVISGQKMPFNTKNINYIDSQQYRKKYYYLETTLENLIGRLPKAIVKIEDRVDKIKNISKYPPIVYDIAFIVKSTLSISQISKFLSHIDEKILMAKLFDIFSSNKIGKDNISLAYHIILQNNHKTMTATEGDKIIKNIKQKIISRYQAVIR